MRHALWIFAIGLPLFNAGCGDTSSRQSQGHSASTTAPAQPSPATFQGVSTGYQASDPR